MIVTTIVIEKQNREKIRKNSPSPPPQIAIRPADTREITRSAAIDVGRPCETITRKSQYYGINRGINC